jgi:hypothetical protein
MRVGEERFLDSPSGCETKDGSAATLLDVVNFYNQRFGIGFTDQQKKDLVNFLNTL